MNDRALRHVNVGLGGPTNGVLVKMVSILQLPQK